MVTSSSPTVQESGYFRLKKSGSPGSNAICGMCWVLPESHTLIMAIIVCLLRNTMVCLQKIVTGN